MTNQAQGKKISDFVAKTTIPSGSYMSYVYSGQNYRILDTDFYSALGVTGTLVQLGGSGVTILDKSGSVNRIRNLEAGSGIALAVSVDNGAKISHNIANGSTGDVSLFQDLTADQLIAKKLTAGAGITITDNGNELVISSP